jgi:hypothetical protein
MQFFCAFPRENQKKRKKSAAHDVGNGFSGAHSTKMQQIYI